MVPLLLYAVPLWTHHDDTPPHTWSTPRPSLSLVVVVLIASVMVTVEAFRGVLSKVKVPLSASVGERKEKENFGVDF